MWTSSQNKFFQIFSFLLLLVGLAGTAQASPVGTITVFGVTSAPYTAGTSTNSLFIGVFDSTNGVVTTIETVFLQVVDAGTVIPNAVNPETFDTVPGQAIYPVTVLYRAGTSSIKIRAFTGSGISGINSTSFSVNPGAAAQIVALAPGETILEGTNPGASTTGKTGSSTPQLANQPFAVTVNVTDAQYNIVNNSDVVHFVSDAGFVTLPVDGALTAGTGSFNVTITSPKISRTLTVSDFTNGAIISGTAGISSIGPSSETVFPYPSPFNPHTGSIKFEFIVDTAKEVTVKVTDQFGQKVWEGSKSAPANTTTFIPWDGRNDRGVIVAAGVYYVMLEVDGKLKSKKRFGVTK